MPNPRHDQAAWDAVAAFWHDRMGEGNDFVDTLVWPRVWKLLPNLDGARVLDVGCGNGLYARKLAAEGARVVAVDYSPRMIAIARSATRDSDIDYRVLDASDPDSLGNLSTDAFDAVLAAMVLMDMSDIGPLLRSLPRLLQPTGGFVFATAHPSFNSPQASLESRPDGSGELHVRSYLTSTRTPGVAIRGQPADTLFYHRPLAELLRMAFESGLVLDAVEEPSFPSDHPRGSKTDSWGGRYHEFPPVLVGRLRPFRCEGRGSR